MSTISLDDDNDSNLKLVYKNSSNKPINLTSNQMFPPLDITSIIDRYDQFISELKVFLESEALPVTKSMLISYSTKCTTYETSLISLKSELSMTKSELNRDFRSSYKTLYDRSSLGQRWETKIGIDMDPIISDIKFNLDRIDTMLSVLEDFKWTLKTNRDTAREYVFHLSDSF